MREKKEERDDHALLLSPSLLWPRRHFFVYRELPRTNKEKDIKTRAYRSWARTGVQINAANDRAIRRLLQRMIWRAALLHTVTAANHCVRSYLRGWTNPYCFTQFAAFFVPETERTPWKTPKPSKMVMAIIMVSTLLLASLCFFLFFFWFLMTPFTRAYHMPHVLQAHPSRCGFYALTVHRDYFCLVFDLRSLAMSKSTSCRMTNDSYLLHTLSRREGVSSLALIVLTPLFSAVLICLSAKDISQSSFVPDLHGLADGWDALCEGATKNYPWYHTDHLFEGSVALVFPDGQSTLHALLSLCRTFVSLGSPVHAYVHCHTQHVWPFSRSSSSAIVYFDKSKPMSIYLWWIMLKTGNATTKRAVVEGKILLLLDAVQREHDLTRKMAISCM